MRRDVVSICSVIFLADIVSGILSPTFSLYAQSLGASLAFIGALSSIAGLTQLLTSMPIGALSDRHGRKIVLTLGMLTFAATTTLYALAPNAVLLIPGRVLAGLASVAMFSVGPAYVSDVASGEERGLAFGIYSTAEGVGFGIGPLIGSAIAVNYGVPVSYLAAAAIACAGAALAAWGLHDRRPAPGAIATRSFRLQREGLARMLRDPRLMAGSLCNLLIGAGFGGAITNFFPVYAAANQVTHEAINSMFAVRAFASTVSRLPSGAITSRLPSSAVMIAALLLAMAAIFSMAQTNVIVVLSALLIVEGFSYGMFLPAGQVFIAEISTPATRGQMMGAYGTAGSLSSALSPFVMGLIAQLWGVQAVFLFTAALFAAGICLAGFLFNRPSARQA